MIWGLVYAFCFLSCYLPQIYKIIRYKNVEGLSLGMFVLSLFGYISMFLAMYTGEVNYNPGMLLNVSIGSIFSSIIIFYILKLKGTTL